MASVEFSPKAVQELQSIWDYTYEVWSGTQADKYYQTLIDACDKIVRNPSLGRNFDGIPTMYLGYREGKHVIVYNVVSPEVIEIVRVLHVSMDFPNQI